LISKPAQFVLIIIPLCGTRFRGFWPTNVTAQSAI
jgi:hypothetical protein